MRGYTDLGRVRIPPLPQIVVLEDRADGTLWALTHDSTGTYVGLTDELPGTRKDFFLYGAWQGPLVPSDHRLRLLVRDGHLGYEEVDHPVGVQDIDNARVLTRRTGATKFEIVKPAAWATGDALAYETEPEGVT